MGHKVYLFLIAISLTIQTPRMTGQVLKALQPGAGRGVSFAAQNPTIIKPRVGTRDTFAIVDFHHVRRPSVALVLSGGGARGLAHIGVLRALERHGIPIDLIVGTSMGAVIGGLYAIGYSPDDLQRMADTTRWDDIITLSEQPSRRELFVDQKSAAERSLIVLRFKGFQPVLPSSVSGSQRLTNLIQTLVLQGIYHPDSSFDDLRVRFRAVATDLISGKRIIFDHGDLAEALRASVTVPLLFSPVKKDSMELVDGGLISNIPVDIAQKLGADIIVAINTTSGLRPPNELSAPWKTADQIVDIMMQLPNQLQLERANLVVTPKLGNHLSSDFTNIDSLIAQGEEAMEKEIQALQNLIISEDQHSQRSPAHGGNPIEKFTRFIISFEGDGIPEKLRDKILRRQSQPALYFSEIQNDVDRLYATGDFAEVHAVIAMDSTKLPLSQLSSVTETQQVEARITYVVRRNPYLQAVQFTGVKSIPLPELQSLFKELLGKPINAFATHRAVERILEIYRRRGFSLATIRKISFDPKTGTAIIAIDEGSIQAVEITGNQKTKDYVILREFSLRAGDIFNVHDANHGVQNIMSTGLFSIVSLRINSPRSNPSLHKLVIEVQEKSSELIRLAFRADNERNLQPYIDIRDENFFGTGSQLGFTFFGGARNQLYRLEHKSSRIFSTYLTFNLRAYYNLTDIRTYGDVPTSSPFAWRLAANGEYRQIVYGGAFTFGGQFGRLGNVTAELREEHQQVYLLSGNAVGPESYWLGALRFSSVVDSRDRVPFPNSGIYMTLSYETASPKIWSDVAYTKIFVSYETYTTYGHHQTIHPRLVFGFADRTLPLTEQFSLGGFYSFYGLREYAFRGRQLFAVNFEYRTPFPLRIFFDTYFSIRYDLGSVWQYPQDIRFKDLRHGAGAAIAFDTPIGPAEFAIGRSFLFCRGLPENPLSLGPWELYFAIGIPAPGND
ncbi:MAG: patatin-like phospholipase family protein [Bacteroidota bacterium]